MPENLFLSASSPTALICTQPELAGTAQPLQHPQQTPQGTQSRAWQPPLLHPIRERQQGHHISLTVLLCSSRAASWGYFLSVLKHQELLIYYMSITVLILLFSQECHKSVSFFQECNTAFADGNVFGQRYLKILHFPVLRQCRQLSEMAVSSILSSLAPVPGTQVPFLSLLTKGNLWGRGDGLAGDAAPAQESVAQCGSCLQVWA